MPVLRPTKLTRAHLQNIFPDFQSLREFEKLLENLDNLEETIDDRVALLIQDGTNITWTYDDAADTLTGQLNDTVVGIDAIQFDKTAAPAHVEGTISWNDDDKTLDIHTEVAGTKIQVGQEQVLRVTNKTGSLIANGAVVYINGAQGQRPTIALADADLSATADATIGVVTADIANNGTGYVTTFGLVRDLNTSAFTEGDVIWLSQTAGEFTNVEPTAPAHSVRLGVVVYQHATEGKIFVHVDNGYEIEELHDVLITSLGDNHHLQYDNASGLWKNSAFLEESTQNITTTATISAGVAFCTNSGYTVTMPAGVLGRRVSVRNQATSGFITVSQVEGADFDLYFGESLDLIYSGSIWTA